MAFEDYLASQAIGLDVTLMAEEFSEELMTRNGASDCTTRSAAQRAGCVHLFCEPSIEERSRMGEDLSAKRECYWLGRIKSSEHLRVLFVCGSEHLSSFKDLLENCGYEASELSRDWGRGWELVP